MLFGAFRLPPVLPSFLLPEFNGDKLGLSCAKLRIVELKIEDNKMLGLNANWGEKHKR